MRPIPDFVAQLLSHPDLSRDSQDILVLTDLVTWAVEKQGYELAVEYVLDWDFINAYAESLIPAYAPETSQRRRARLRTTAVSLCRTRLSPTALHCGRNRTGRGLDELRLQRRDQYPEQTATRPAVPRGRITNRRSVLPHMGTCLLQRDRCDAARCGRPRRTHEPTLRRTVGPRQEPVPA